MTIRQLFEYYKIKKSGLFDVKFYQDRYNINKNPIQHYIKHGANDGMMPNTDFDTKFYKEKYMDKYTQVNPLYFYIKEGIKNHHITNDIITINIIQKLLDIIHYIKIYENDSVVLVPKVINCDKFTSLLLNKFHESEIPFDVALNVDYNLKSGNFNLSTETVVFVMIFKILIVLKKTCVIFSHNLGGGTEVYLKNKINELRDEIFVITVKYNTLSDRCFLVDIYYKNMSMCIKFDNYLSLFCFFKNFSFDDFVISSLVGYKDLNEIIKSIIELKKNINKLKLLIHDYFIICPCCFLVDSSHKFCDIPSDIKICNTCLHSNEKYSIEADNILVWRQMWYMLIRETDEIICFSNSSVQILSKVYLHKNIKVIPHIINLNCSSNIFDLRLLKSKRVIGILGNITIHKGLKKIELLCKYIYDNNLDIKIVILGNIFGKFKSDIPIVIEQYDLSNLIEKIKKYEITDFFIPSICPETFSYTTSEIMHLGYPLTVFNIGAPAERVLNYKYGNVIEILEFEKIITDKNYLNRFLCI